MDLPETLNAAFIDAQYQRWKSDANSVSEDWRFFFRGFETALDRYRAAPSVRDEEADLRQSRVDALIYRYRELGHLLSCLDPLSSCTIGHPLLDLEAFDLTSDDLEAVFSTPEPFQSRRTTLGTILQVLKQTYCRSVGVEYMHLQDPTERLWLQERMEPAGNRPALSDDCRRGVVEKLMRASLFEAFLNRKYKGQTRFSLEGAEIVIPMLDAFLDRLSALGGREIILGMAHRGRLNVQAHILAKPYDQIFSEFESCYDPEDLIGSGDVKYHNGYMAEIEYGNDRRLQAFLVNNPSHLESVSYTHLRAHET